VNVDRILKGSLVGMFIAFILVLYASLHETALNIGDSAPTFTITADGGKQVSPRKFGGKALLLNFWATWCGPCQEEIPSLKALARMLEPQGLVVLAISQDEDDLAYSRFNRQMHLNFLTVRQPEKTIQLSYGTTQIPESYLIDRDGIVRAKFISNQTWTSPAILAQIKSLL